MHFSYQILITYDGFTNLEALNDFFIANPMLQNHIFNINKVNNDNTDYYDSQSSQEILDKRAKQLNYLFEKYQVSIKAKEENKFLEKLFNGMKYCKKIK
jgi:hypothetical protein